MNGVPEARIHTDMEYVRGQLARIATLTDEGLLAEARAASADLLFDLQPLIVACEELFSKTLDVLERCHATALYRRLLIAAHGDTPSSALGPATRPGPRPALAAKHHNPRTRAIGRTETAGV